MEYYSVHSGIRAGPQRTQQAISELHFASVSKQLQVPFIWKISFIHMEILVHLHVNKTNFHMKGFTLGLTLKQM